MIPVPQSICQFAIRRKLQTSRGNGEDRDRDINSCQIDLQVQKSSTDTGSLTVLRSRVTFPVGQYVVVVDVQLKYYDSGHFGGVHIVWPCDETGGQTIEIIPVDL